MGKELYESATSRREDAKRFSQATMLEVAANESDPTVIAAGVNAIQSLLEARGEVTLTSQ